MHVEFWFDFSCPYAYVAARRIAQVAADGGAELIWCPMLLGGVFRATGAGDGPMATLIPPRADHNRRDMFRWAERAGVPLVIPPGHPNRTVRALRVLLGLPRDTWAAAIAAIYAAYWERGEDVTLDEVIDGALAAAGIAPALRQAAFATADDDRIKDELRRRTEQAVGHGIFGAPATIVVGDDGRRTLFWGQDRLHHVAAALRGWQADVAGPPGGALPGDLAAVEPAPPLASPPAVDFWFDYASPFAYLGATQIARVAAAAGAPLTYRPMLLGALFRQVGTPDVPLFAMPEAKRRYLGAELDRWARWWGVPFRFTSRFPMKTVNALRLTLLAGDRTAALVDRLFRALWVEDRDLDDRAVLAALAAEVGLGADVVEASAAPAARLALVEATTAARDAGVFGAPTCVVHDPGGPLLFWGQDRLDLVAAALRGWRPAVG